MGAVKSYRDLIVWQKSMWLTKMVYVLTKRLPKEELNSLSDQMRRAAVSIPSNIAEGNAKLSSKDYANFLAIARGSKSELETQLLICVDIGYLTEEDTAEAMGLCTEIDKMLYALIARLRQRAIIREKYEAKAAGSKTATKPKAKSKPKKSSSAEVKAETAPIKTTTKKKSPSKAKITTKPKAKKSV